MNTLEQIAAGYDFLLKKLPEIPRSDFLITGGSAAWFYGSDRPFSDDIDVMLPEKWRPIIEKQLAIIFELKTNKPVFHSLSLTLLTEKMTFDLILKSVIDIPDFNDELKATFLLNDQIIQKKIAAEINGITVSFLPKELLILIKLLAARGQKLGKYDLYDVNKIFTSLATIDMTFFESLMCQFCQPLNLSKKRLLNSAKIILDDYNNQAMKDFISWLESL